MIESLTFWILREERDYHLLLELNHSSHQADHDPDPTTLEEIAHFLANMDGLSAGCVRLRPGIHLFSSNISRPGLRTVTKMAD